MKIQICLKDKSDAIIGRYRATKAEEIIHEVADPEAQCV